MSEPTQATPVNKSSVGVGVRQFHIGIAPGEVSTIALLPGDPFRVPLIAEFLTDVKDIAHNREHRTMTGMYKGKKITATSTGMGCPSTAIAVEELARVGVTSFIRVGSSAGLQHYVNPGDLLISEGSLRNDGTTAAYVLPGYPAVPDLRLTLELERTARALAARQPEGQPGTFAVHSGLSVSDDAFYAETPAWIAQLNTLGILNVEMEASALYVVARLRGLRAGMICSCSSNLVSGASLYDDVHTALKSGWLNSIEAALETAVNLDL
jgi:uridine phosphorylase